MDPGKKCSLVYSIDLPRVMILAKMAAQVVLAKSSLVKSFTVFSDLHFYCKCISKMFTCTCSKGLVFHNSCSSTIHNTLN